MRPIKQAGVVSTHSVLYFAPAAASVGSGAALLLLHVSREGFFFISACMLTYAYVGLKRSDLPRFYWRRFVSVGIPYLCWNFIYFLWGFRDTTYPTAWAALDHLWRLISTGYYQLYFLLVIMEFYLVFPLVLVMLKRTRGHHGLVLAATALLQLGVSIVTHWHLLPRLMVTYAQQDALSYVLFLVGGSIVAFHLEEVHDWVVRHSHLIYFLTVVAAVFAEGVYFAARDGFSWLGSGSDPFQPSVIPFNVGAIACGYLAGVALVQPWRSKRTRALVRMGSDDAYGIYLSQMLFITFLEGLHWSRLNNVLPWPVVSVITVVVIFLCASVLTALLARTPLAVPLTGRKQVPLSTLIPAQWRPRHDEASQAAQSQDPRDTDVLDDRVAAEPGIGQPDLVDTGLAGTGLEGTGPEDTGPVKSGPEVKGREAHLMAPSGRD
jgi:surface polysaccharide O-acyltransferase-like enzyme